MSNKDILYIFVIDTEEYAGNFERQLCAYITGCIGDCGVGEEERIQYNNDETMNFDDSIRLEPDEHGCNRPVILVDTPGWFNNGLGGHFRDGTDEQVVLDHHKQVAKEHGLPAHGKMAKFPACLSVGVLFETKPTAKEIALMKRRAEAYLLKNNIPLTGFRLLTRETVMTETSKSTVPDNPRLRR
jgi:hypothetical protein